MTKSAKIVTTFADIAPGNAPDPAAASLAAAAEARVAPLRASAVVRLRSAPTRLPRR